MGNKSVLKIVSITIVIASMLCLATILPFTSLAQAAQLEDKSDKLYQDDIAWDNETQQFIISVSCKRGIATAGEHADFTISTNLLVTKDNKEYFILTPNKQIVKLEDAEKGSAGYVQIEPLAIIGKPAFISKELDIQPLPVTHQ
jgi:hypothetical protein